MASNGADVVICGAGIAGVSLAYRLAVRHGVRDVLLVDDRPPLSLTSDKSTEAYRNWWPGPDDAMIRLMNRSVDLLEELAADCDNRFLLNRRGYLYCTADPEHAAAYHRSAELASAQGAGELRVHRGRSGDPDYVPHQAVGHADTPGGADLILDQDLLRRTFPYLSDRVCAALHTRRCGWFSGQQLGMEQLERARAAGVRLMAGRLEGVLSLGDRVTGVRIARTGDSVEVPTRRLVLATGPMTREAARLLDVDLPLYSELHLKVAFRISEEVVPRDAPLLVWDDAQRLSWTPAERDVLLQSEDSRWLVEELPPGVHMRPEGHDSVLILWPYHVEPVPETFPIAIPREYAEVCLRGMATLVPSLGEYFHRPPTPFVDGGYYTRTPENRPLACPLPMEGAFLHGALSGFGLMASSATAELVAAHITGSTLPDYAPAFTLDRYRDPEYLRKLDQWEGDGQL
jgi:glycine/D-amino acid oxidase-like deaminating enzyme